MYVCLEGKYLNLRLRLFSFNGFSAGHLATKGSHEEGKEEEQDELQEKYKNQFNKNDKDQKTSSYCCVSSQKKVFFITSLAFLKVYV